MRQKRQRLLLFKPKMIKVIQALSMNGVLLSLQRDKREGRLKILVRQRTDLFSEAMHLMLTRLLGLHESLDPQLLLR